jgi:hypothetical protein
MPDKAPGTIGSSALIELVHRYVTLQATVNLCTPELAMSPDGKCGDDSKVIFNATSLGTSMNEVVYSCSALSPWAHKSDETCDQSNYLFKKVIHAELSRGSPEHHG